MLRAIATPMIDATIPMPNMRAIGCCGWPWGVPSSDLTAGDPSSPGGGKGAPSATCESAQAARAQTAAGWPPEPAAPGGGGPAGARRAMAGPAEARRRRAVVAPERLGELGRLAVADAVGHL